MDRNRELAETKPDCFVATREGGVDRNIVQDMADQVGNASPPARVAWIETQQVFGSLAAQRRRHPRGWRG